MISPLSLGEMIQVTLTSLMIVMALFILFQEKKAKTPPAPTMPWIRKRIITLLTRYVPRDSAVRMVDLGCGWGGMTVSMAKAYKNATIHGYEITTFPYLVAKITSLFFLGRIQIHNSNMYKADLSQFQVLYCYLPTFILTDLLPQFASLRPGTVIVTSGWAIPGYTPTEVISESLFGIKMPIYIYLIPPADLSGPN